MRTPGPPGAAHDRVAKLVPRPLPGAGVGSAAAAAIGALRALGAPSAAVGLFLTALTFGSALSAAWTGALGDRLGRRRLLTAAGLAMAGFSAAYAVLEVWWLLVALGFPFVGEPAVTR